MELDEESWRLASIQAGRYLPRSQEEQDREDATRTTTRLTKEEFQARLEAAREASKPKPRKAKATGSSKTLSYAGEPCTLDQIRGTLGVLKYYRAFLRSEARECYDLQQAEPSHWYLKKDAAQRRLRTLVHVAINRKAGIPDVGCRKQDPDYQADLKWDCGQIRDYLNHRRPIRELRTKELQQRYGHLASEREGG